MIKGKEELEEIAKKGLEKVLEMGVKEAEVFVSSNGVDITKINYTSDILCNGVEQPYYSETNGCSVRIVFNDGRYGFGSESSLSVDAVVNAAKKAEESAYPDPFVSALPRPSDEKPKLSDYHDQRILESGGPAAVEFGWKAVDGLIETFRQNGFKAKDRIVLNGDLTTIREIMAIASSTGIEVSDVSTLMMAYLTTMIQAHDAKGTGWATGSTIDTFTPEDAGRMAALSAIKTIGGQRIESGAYNIVLGPQAVTDLVINLLEPGVRAEAIAFGESPFLGKYGKQVVSPLLSLYDDGSIEGLAASKAYTCEGLPTKRTDLIKEGKLVGFLSTHGTARIWGREPLNEKVSDYLISLSGFLGTSAIPNLEGRNGFRYGGAGGRVYMAAPSASATNLFIEGNETTPEDELTGMLGDGIYIGRLWYTYPINGLAKGDVTSTVIADSYVVRDGKIAYPLKPNTVRLNDNIVRMFNNILAVGDRQQGTIVWAAESIVQAPHILMKDVRLDNVAGYMD